MFATKENLRSLDSLVQKYGEEAMLGILGRCEPDEAKDEIPCSATYGAEDKERDFRSC